MQAPYPPLPNLFPHTLLRSEWSEMFILESSPQNLPQTSSEAGPRVRLHSGSKYRTVQHPPRRQRGAVVGTKAPDDRAPAAGLTASAHARRRGPVRRQSPLAHMRPEQWRGQCAAGRAKHSKAAAQRKRREGGWISPVVQTMGRAALHRHSPSPPYHCHRTRGQGCLCSHRPDQHTCQQSCGLGRRQVR